MWSASPKHRDDVDDDELVVNQFTKGNPITITGFNLSHSFDLILSKSKNQ
jgi:hypothetical protein